MSDPTITETNPETKPHHKMCSQALDLASKNPDSIPLPDGVCLCGTFASSDAHLLIDLEKELKDEPTCSPEVLKIIQRKSVDAILVALMATTKPRASDAGF